MQHEAPLATIFLCGSILEGLLLGIACAHPQQFNQSAGSAKDKNGKVKQFHEWSLAQFIDVACEEAQLAQLLYQADKMDEAIEHYEELLRLNPGDNQGLRYSLLGCYLEQGNLTGAQRLFSEFEDEGIAMFAWARMLAEVLADNKKEAAKTLKAAREVNKHVEAFLTGRKKLPSEGPAYYGFGDPNEAIICVHEIGTAWTRHPESIAWLKKQKPKRK